MNILEIPMHYAYIYVCIYNISDMYQITYIQINFIKKNRASKCRHLGSHENLVTIAFDKRWQMTEFTTRHLKPGIPDTYIQQEFEIVVLDFCYDPASHHIKPQSNF